MEEGVSHAGRKRGRVEAATPREGAHGECGHHSAEDGSQHDAWDGCGSSRRALATGHIEAVDGPVQRGLDCPDDLGNPTGGRRHHPVRHEASDERCREHRHEEETSPDGHTVTITVDLKSGVRIG